MTLWGALFFGGFAMLAIQTLALDVPKGAPFAVAGAAFFVGIPLLVYFTRQKTYAQTEYRFYPDKLDYFEGFFTTEEKSIQYDYITEVNLRRGVFQKMYGLGTIVLSTPATGMVSGRMRSGILIADIPNADRVYSQIKDLLKRF
jgi:membrane protein YdbS with pleckstrin-like domain